jgi:hypothetical protein
MAESKFFKEFENLMFQKNSADVNESFFYRKMAQDI